ncbi:MAG: hypothetical protein IE928_08395 [Gammaproteobacteria bacterium]|nr:hypothetical protein [Gammaproteobacteria bacterium]
MIYKKYYDLLEVQDITGVEPLAICQGMKEVELFHVFKERIVGRSRADFQNSIVEKLKDIHNQYLERLNDVEFRKQFKDVHEAWSWSLDMTYKSFKNAEIVKDESKEKNIETMGNTAYGFTEIYISEPFKDEVEIIGFNNGFGDFFIRSNYVTTFDEIFIKFEALERIKAMINSEPSSEQTSTPTDEAPTAKGLNINETRLQAFKFWVAGKGGVQAVEKMTKQEVWDELHKIEPRLFSSGNDSFFENSSTKQTLVKFKAGKRT